MKKLQILIFSVILFNSCLPLPLEQISCLDVVKCHGTTGKTYLKAYLSNTDTVLYLGDTLRFYARIPDTLTVRDIDQNPDNQFSNIEVKHLYASKPSTINLNVYKHTDIESGYHSTNSIDSMSQVRMPREVIKHGEIGTINPDQVNIKWKPDTREIECNFILSKTGIWVMYADAYITLETPDGRKLHTQAFFNFFDKKESYYVSPRFGILTKNLSLERKQAIQEQLKLYPRWCFSVVKC